MKGLGKQRKEKKSVWIAVKAAPGVFQMEDVNAACLNVRKNSETEKNLEISGPLKNNSINRRSNSKENLRKDFSSHRKSRSSLLRHRKKAAGVQVDQVQAIVVQQEVEVLKVEE